MHTHTHTHTRTHARTHTYTDICQVYSRLQLDEIRVGQSENEGLRAEEGGVASLTEAGRDGGSGSPEESRREGLRDSVVSNLSLKQGRA